MDGHEGYVDCSEGKGLFFPLFTSLVPLTNS
jgi:hypothetical protein